MAKNFDESHREKRRTRDQRTFILREQEFVVKPGVRPEDLSSFDELTALGDDPPIVQMMGLIDTLFKTLIEPGRESAYDAIRAVDHGDDVLTADELREVIEWMIEVSTDRPTGRPSASTDGPGHTGAGSTDDSSSPALREVSTA